MSGACERESGELAPGAGPGQLTLVPPGLARLSTAGVLLLGSLFLDGKALRAQRMGDAESASWEGPSDKLISKLLRFMFVSTAVGTFWVLSPCYRSTWLSELVRDEKAPRLNRQSSGLGLGRSHLSPSPAIAVQAWPSD